ncbi:MAG TPA: M14 metallopeptidase family protein, partial [Thermoanaerobaculia bacterium]
MIRRAWIVLALVATPLFAQNVPTPEQFLGYKLGDRFTQYSRILDYFNTLAAKSPLITIQQFGETYEHRPLILAEITSPKNRNVNALDFSRSGPAVVWLAFGVHGNETSSSEAAMEVASTLLNDPASSKILDNLIVLIDPLQNPDGRERYVTWFTRTRGESANANPDAAEHQEPWPGGRYNHYLIDMNRDWAWTSQRETRARVAEYRKWYPQVFVDFHEMGSNSTYFFPPDAKPINANLPKDVEKWLDVFGRANAAAFTEKGWPFFVGEVFDLFYPGYGDSWPSLHGAIGMTYEVAGGGRGGSEFVRDDGTTLTLAHRIDEHYTTGMATLRSAADHASELVAYTNETLRSAAANGQNTYLILPTSPNFQPLIDMLQRQSIQIGTLTAPATLRATAIDGDTAENQSFPAGTAVISTKQPLGRLVQTLFEKSPAFSKGFIEEQRQRTDVDEPTEFYDLTAWSLPLAMDVDAFVTTAPVTASNYQPSAAPAFRPAAYAYLIDGNDPDIYRAAGKMLASGVRFSVTEEPITVGDRTFARGTAIILKGNNASNLDATLTRIGREENIAFAPVESGWTGGMALGSERIHPIRDPKIGLVGGPGVGATSYGMLWHTLDIDTPVPHTNLTLDSLRNIDLSHYNVLILPDGGGYSRALGKDGIARLQAWTRSGGTIVAIKGASDF